MNGKYLLFTVGLGALLLLGCRRGADPYLSRTSLTMLESARPEKSPDEVEVYEDKNSVTEEYDVVALMQAEGRPQDLSRFRNAFRQRTAAIGADALIFKRVVLDDDSGVRIAAVGAFRGEAIVFRRPAP